MDIVHYDVCTKVIIPKTWYFKSNLHIHYWASLVEDAYKPRLCGIGEICSSNKPLPSSEPPLNNGKQLWGLCSNLPIGFYYRTTKANCKWM